MCHGKIHTAASPASRRNTVLQLLMIQDASNEPDFLKKVITRDESWDYGYDLETKVQLSQWKSLGSPHLKKVRQSNSKIKIMLTVFVF